jgi:uncharacterized protein (TIGR03435 family)
MISAHFRRSVPLTALAFAAAVAYAQSPAPKGFEVASIHPNNSGGDNTHINRDEGHVTFTNASLKTLIRNGYEILSFQLTGGPGWLDSDKFDIEAKAGGGETMSDGEFKEAIRNLLADRFRLKVHWETREGPVYVLTVDKNGLKFKENAGAPGPSMNTHKGPAGGKMTGTKVPISILASNLANQLGRIVLDKTDLKGDYDFSFEWATLDLASPGAADLGGPSLFTALTEQLGLRLESQKKGAMEVLVIDSVEKPSEN